MSWLFYFWNLIILFFFRRFNSFLLIRLSWLFFIIIWSIIIRILLYGTRFWFSTSIFLFLFIWDIWFNSIFLYFCFFGLSWYTFINWHTFTIIFMFLALMFSFFTLIFHSHCFRVILHRFIIDSIFIKSSSTALTWIAAFYLSWTFFIIIFLFLLSVLFVNTLLSDFLLCIYSCLVGMWI